jgi:hypothetical protein
MGANSTQALGLVLMLIAFVVLAGGFAGGGVALIAGALVLVGISCAVLMKAKSQEQQEE